MIYPFFWKIWIFKSKMIEKVVILELGKKSFLNVCLIMN